MMQEFVWPHTDSSSCIRWEVNEMVKSLAWGDESVRHKGIPHPMYVMCACTIADEDDAREVLKKIKPSGANKLHWRQMTSKDKRKAMATIGTLDSLSFIIASEQINQTSGERARRKCLERLLPLLEQHGVNTLILESRTDAQDQRDRQLLSYMRTSHILTSIRLNHIRGADEPCLWLPDQILGAYGDTHTGEMDFSDFLNERVLDEVIRC